MQRIYIQTRLILIHVLLIYQNVGLPTTKSQNVFRTREGNSLQLKLIPFHLWKMYCQLINRNLKILVHGREQEFGDGLKAGVHLKAVFWLGIMFLMQISRLRFKQSRICSLITHIYVLRRFVNFLVIFRFIWRQIVFLKGLVKFMEIGNLSGAVYFKVGVYLN